MKVLFINTVPTQRNGITNVIFNYIANLNYPNLTIGYVSISQLSAEDSSFLSKKGVEQYIIPRKITSPWIYMRQLFVIMKNYEIIHVHGNSATMVLEMVAAKLAGIRVRIAHSHNTSCKMKFIDFLARPLFYSLCNVRLACSEDAGKWLFKNKKFYVVKNGINSERFRFSPNSRARIRRNLGIDDEIVVGHIGNFVEQKNHDYLIDIFYHINKISTKSKLLLLGEGFLQKKIKEKVDKLGLSASVMFIGCVQNVEEYISSMDIVIMPSLFEGLPLTLIEEQANGIPIIAANTITKEANLTGLVNFLPLSVNAQIWAKESIEIIKNNVLHDERTSEIAIYRIKEAEYDINTVVKTLMSHYENQIAR